MRHVGPQRIGTSPRGVVSSQHFLASEAGASLLARGGNAVDAAVATALALGVVEPNGSGLGGQTAMMIHLADPRQTVALDGSSRAPNRVTAETLRTKKDRLRGYLATTVPSTPATLAYAQQRYGKRTWAECLAPAIELAEEGYPIPELQHRLQIREAKHWADGNAGDFFLKDGQPFAVGDRFRQPVLARTLRCLANEGVEDFYQGEIAQRIHADMEAHGGAIHLDDLALIPWPIERKPLSCRFDGQRILTFPPPGAGRTLVEMLQILEHFPAELRSVDTPAGALLLAEVIRRAQLDRSDRPYDPSFYPQSQDRRMTSPAYAEEMAKQIRRRMKVAALKKESTPREDDETEADESRGETTHLSVMDEAGNAVALTQSIERVYGSFVVTPELGFLYNNYLSAFEYSDPAHPYYLRPNAVPWASVVPTLVFRGRKLHAALGSPGSDRITSAVLQVLLRLGRQSPMDAVLGPRLHATARGRLSYEAPWLRDDVPPLLERAGYQLDPREAQAFFMGCVQLVVRDGQTFVGVADPRRDGAAVGPRP